LQFTETFEGQEDQTNPDGELDEMVGEIETEINVSNANITVGQHT